MEKLLEVKNLNISFHTYAGEVKAVRGVNFGVEKGECLAIVGESGCGKTVTSKSLLGLISSPPGEIKKGSEINFNGTNILEFSEKQWREYRGKIVSMIFQDPMTSLNPTMKIGKQIAENIVLHKKVNKKEAMMEVIKLLKSVNIPNAELRVNEYPHQFSGGMRQRAMIAMALACNPELLIADEPTTALDVTIQAQILDLMKEIKKKLGTSVILITHDLGVVAGIAEKIAVMYAGEIVEMGMRDEIFYNPKHPYTTALLGSVPRLDSNKEQELQSIKGTPTDLLNPPKGCAFAARCNHRMKICTLESPERFKLSDTHESCCWLLHPMCKNKNRQELGGDSHGRR